MSAPECGYVFDGRTCRKRGAHRCDGRVRHVVAFFAELLVFTKGDYARHPFLVRDWQRRRILSPLFGEVVFDVPRQRYVRRYRTLYLFLPRKQGKSELVAGIMLYMLVGDGEEGAEVYGLARDRDQAGHVYRAAARMVQLSPVLSERLGIYKGTNPRIVDDRSASFFATTAGDDQGALGANPHGAYIDELLTQPDRDLYDAIRTGMGARAQPILVLATTAENDPNGFAATEREYSLRVAAEPELDPARLVVAYAAPSDADWTDERVWKAANPALGDFLDIRVLRDECRQAIANPAAESSFRQFRLNQPTRPVSRAVAMPVWDASAGPQTYDQLALTLLGQVCYAGLDLASTGDLASYALDFPDNEGGHDVLWRHFAPTAALPALDRRTGARASVWAGLGLLTLTEGNVIDYGAIRQSLREDRERYGITEIAFDRWGATQLSTEMIEEGFPLIQVGQGFAAFAAPTAELLRSVAKGTYRHGANPLVRWEASNLVTRADPVGNLRPDKERSMDKIDGIVAAIMALDRASRHREAAPPVEYTVAGF